MKYVNGILSILMALFLVTDLAAQEYRQTINRDYKAYTQLIIDKKFDESMHYTNPVVFEVVPKNTLIQAMKQAFAAPGLDFQLELPVIVRFGELKTVDQVDYVRLGTLNIIRIKVRDTLAADPNKYMTAFKRVFGDENVQYNEKTGAFRIESSKVALASSTDKGRNWKFVVLDNNRIVNMLRNIIPEEVLVEGSQEN